MCLDAKTLSELGSGRNPDCPGIEQRAERSLKGRLEGGEVRAERDFGLQTLIAEDETMNGRRIGLTALHAALVLSQCLTGAGLAWETAAPAGTGHPETLELRDWKSASYLLDADGRVKDPDEYAGVRESLNNQSARFVEKFGPAGGHGLREGQVPPRSFCVPGGVYLGGGEFYGPPSHNGMFDAAVLLGEVAVEATIVDIIPGFSRGWPYLLLALSSVVPLHDDSPSPAYVLVPVYSMVTHGRVFCGGEAEKGFVAGVDYEIGARLAVVGSWHEGVVPMGVGAGSAGLLAEVRKGGALDWLFTVNEDPPRTLPDMRRRVEDLVSGGLLATTTVVRRAHEVFGEGRMEVGDLVRSVYKSGCRLVGAEPLAQPDGGWRYARICAEGEPEAAARKLNRPVAELCIDSSTTRSTSMDGVWGPAKSCAVEQ